MNYTLCNNSTCPQKDGCMRWKNYIGQSSSVMNESQMTIKTFEPLDKFICKYKIDK